MAVLGPVATSLPRHRLLQSELRAVALAVTQDAGLVEVFDNGRIEGRNLACEVPWYLEPHRFEERERIFVEVGLPMVEEAARKAVAAAGTTPHAVRGIVFVTTTGIATPSLDARLCNLLDFTPDVVRLPVWGLGCGGGVAGVARASELATALNGPVLLVCLELCSLSFDIEKALGRKGSVGPDKKSIVAASLFADGCAATVVSPGGAGPRLIATRSHLWRDTERVMGWDVRDHNLEVVLSPAIPDIVRRDMRGVVDTFLRDANGGRRPDRWVLHPGGAKVVDAFRDALGLAAHDTRFTDATLRAHGNMSSPTALFVLQAAAKEMKPGETALLAALGPGFAAELALVRT